MRLGVCRIAAVIVVLCGGAVRPASSVPDSDACKMVTPAQLSSALGVKMAEGKHTTETYVKTCTWNTAEKATPELKFVTLDLETPEQFDAGKRMAEKMQGRMEFETVRGLGDDAYFSSMASGKIMNLLVRKGSGVFKFAIYGDMASDKKKAAAKEIAGEVVGKL